MPQFNPGHSTIVRSFGIRTLDILLLVLLACFLVDSFDFSLLLEPTIMTGGDSASWYQIALTMKEELLPHGKLMGWNQDNFLGYPEFQYYFIFPFLLAVSLSYLMPLTIALKIVSVLGMLALPFTTYFALNHIRYRRPIPMIGAWLSLIFVFHERYNMFGANALSTLAGEFSYSLAFMLQVIFMATLIRGQQTNRSVFVNAILLAIIGLSHAFVFLTAVFMPIFFWWKKDNCRENMLWIGKIYLLAFLLMAFWTIPMLAQIGFTTPVRMIWVFSSVENFLHMANYEILLAGVAALLPAMVYKHTFSQWKFYGFMILISITLYFSASALHVPDIRFFPPIIFFSLMLVADGSHSLLARLENHFLPSSALLLLAILAGGSWLYHPGNEASAWWRWNLSGYETKQAFKDGSMKKLAGLLKADDLAPRVAWEKSNYNSNFGSDRVFENLPLFTGRRTLEGIHYSAALLSKPLSWLLGEYSLIAASPEALVYAHYNIAVLPQRFSMFNISEIIVRSAEMKQLLQESGVFTRTGDIDELSVFKFNGDTGGYVSTPRFRPQLADLDKDSWRNAYYSWFQRPENLSHFVVSKHFVDADHSELFPEMLATIDARGEMAQTRSESVRPALIAVQVLDNDEISFQTDSPGEPHIIKVAYSPNWQSDSGETIFPVSPGLMLVYPKNGKLSLHYRRSVAEIIGISLTVLGFLVIITTAMRKMSGRSSWNRSSWASTTPGSIAATLCSFRRPLTVLLVFALLLLAIQSFNIKQQTKGDYRAGIQFKSSGDARAEMAFLHASSDDRIKQFPQNPDIPHAMTALAWLYTEQGKDTLAVEQYQRLLKYYPNWIFIHQVYDGIAQIKERNGQVNAAIDAFDHCARIDRFSSVGKRCQAKFKELKLEQAEGSPQ